MTLPDTQLAADTTDLSAFGVGLKLVAAQDVGGRDQDLFDAVLVDDRESAAHVVQVLGQALADRPGAQVLTDQGTPYVAVATREALDALGAEHAPQKEADPCGKSTVERVFETCKSILGPLLALTDRLAAAVPALHDGMLAKAVATLLLTAMLRAYQAGARLLLAHVHELYGIARPLRSFVDSLRRYHPDVLLAAERDFRRQVHRDDIRDRASYFAAIVRNNNEERRRRIACLSRQRAQDERMEAQARSAGARRARWLLDPAGWLRDALALLACHWRPATRELLFGGAGPAAAWIRGAVDRLAELHGPLPAEDTARAVLHGFRLAQLDRLGPEALDAIAAVLERHLAPLRTADPTTRCAPDAASAILGRTGRNQRPPPRDRLRT